MFASYTWKIVSDFRWCIAMYIIRLESYILHFSLPHEVRSKNLKSEWRAHKFQDGSDIFRFGCKLISSIIDLIFFIFSHNKHDELSHLSLMLSIEANISPSLLQREIENILKDPDCVTKRSEYGKKMSKFIIEKSFSPRNKLGKNI